VHGDFRLDNLVYDEQLQVRPCTVLLSCLGRSQCVHLLLLIGCQPAVVHTAVLAGNLVCDEQPQVRLYVVGKPNRDLATQVTPGQT
jgi:hypothetical protein